MRSPHAVWLSVERLQGCDGEAEPGLQEHVGHEEGLVLEDASARLMTIRKNVFQVRASSVLPKLLYTHASMPTMSNTVVSQQRSWRLSSSVHDVPFDTCGTLI